MAFFAMGCGDDDEHCSLDDRLAVAIAEAQITSLDPGPRPETAKVVLGRALMFDKELSGNRDISCATCHHPLLHTGDDRSLPVGTGGTGLGPDRIIGVGRNFVPRNAPEVFNRGSAEWKVMFWDVRAQEDVAGGFLSPAGPLLPDGLDNVLAVQAMFPVTSVDEMRGMPGDVDVFGQPNELALIDGSDFPAIWDALIDRILAFPEYEEMFHSVYPEVQTEDLGFEHAANAIAAFEIDAWTYVDSPWDRYLAGDRNAMSESAKAGALLFFSDAGCVDCHSGNLLTDQKPHNIGVPQIGPGKGQDAPLDYGCERVTGLEAERFTFRTPPLRNVALTGPWMHDGAYASLEAAVRHHLDPSTSLRSYDANQLAPELRGMFHGEEETIGAVLSNLDPLVATPRYLSDAEVHQIMEFLAALTDPAAVDLSDQVPESVPSGLPVVD